MRKLDRNTFKLKIIDVNAGWMLVEYTLGDITNKFDITCVMGDGFDCMLDAAYYFKGDHHDPQEECGTNYSNHYSYFRYVGDDGKEFYLDDLPEEEEKAYWREHSSIAEGPLRMKFTWDSEPIECEWTIERLSRYDVDESDLRITVCDDDEDPITFEIGYRDFCYAVVRAYNEYLLKVGFTGFHYGAYYYEISVHKFLYLKALVLGKLDMVERVEVDKKLCMPSDIHKEIELLLMEM